MKTARCIRYIIPAATIWISYACVDPSGTNIDAEPGRFGSTQSALIASEFNFVPVAQVKLEVEGDLRPNHEIRLKATATGTNSASVVELRITAPEVEAARMSAWNSGFKIPVGRPLPSLTSVRTSLGPGQVIARETTITIPAAGYYRVVASTRALDQPQPSGETQRIADASHSTVWLYVSDDGGRVTATFDPAVLPDTAVRQPGPLRFVTKPRSERASNEALAAFRSPGTRTWEVMYLDQYWNQYEYLIGARVTGTEGLAGDPPTPVNAVTGAGGQFETGCDDQFIYGYSLDVRVEDAAVVVEPNTIVAGIYSAPPGCGVEQVVVDHNEEAHVFTQMRIALNNAVPFFNWGRSQTRVSISTLSAYDYINDKVLIEDSIVFSLAVEEVSAHEYGHAYHFVALGGTAGPPFCQFHGYNAYTDLQCAYDEGFAEYFAVIARPDVLTSLAEQLDDNDFLLMNSNPDENDPNDPDGSVIEGAVAALLYDLTDSANESHDAVSFSGRYVVDLMRTCQVADGGGNLAHAKGVDHFIRCLENQVDSNINGYFYYRSPASTSYAESASEPGSWNLTNIRNLWKKNLFNQ